MENTVEIEGVRLKLSQQHDAKGEWIGQTEILKQLLACWLTINDEDLPLTPRLVGTPGIGKTTLAIAGARIREQDLFIYQCTADTRPEDLLVTPVLAESGKIAYHASPLVTAMITGGICILDEGNRMNEKSWASLAPLLDYRRYVESIVAGITVRAHPDFRRGWVHRLGTQPRPLKRQQALGVRHRRRELEMELGVRQRRPEGRPPKRTGTGIGTGEGSVRVTVRGWPR